MPYPFVQNMRNMEDAAYKLKVLSVAMNKPISKVAARAIEKAFEEYDRIKVGNAIIKVGVRKDSDGD